MGNWQRLVWNQRDALLAGIVVTIKVCAIAFVIAVLVGLLLRRVRMYVRPLRVIAIVLRECFRSPPLRAQLLWVRSAWPALFGWPDPSFPAARRALPPRPRGSRAATSRVRTRRLCVFPVLFPSDIGLSLASANGPVLGPVQPVDLIDLIGSQHCLVPLCGRIGGHASRLLFARWSRRGRAGRK